MDETSVFMQKKAHSIPSYTRDGAAITVGRKLERERKREKEREREREREREKEKMKEMSQYLFIYFSLRLTYYNLYQIIHYVSLL